MSIPTAYCVESKSIIKPRGASHLYFAQDALPRLDLNFQCPNPRCRATIFGVNYKATQGKNRRLPTVYFRTHIDHPHSESCPFIKVIAKKRTRSTILDELPEVSFFNPLSNNIPDNPEIDIEIDTEKEDGIGLVLDREETNEERELKLRRKMTRDLDALAVAFEQLRDLDKKRTDDKKFLDQYKIRIGEKEKTFRWWFKYVPYTCPKKGERIYYGHAHVSKNEFRYKLAFIKETDENDLVPAGLPIGAYIPLSTFTKSNIGKPLQKLLDHFCNQVDQRLSIYIFTKAEFSTHVSGEVRLNIKDLSCVSVWVPSYRVI